MSGFIDGVFNGVKAIGKPKKVSVSMRDKVRIQYMDFFESIMKYNRTIAKIADTGLTLQSIKILFNAQYINYKEEMQKLNPDANLQYSGGKGSGVGPVEIPLLSPDQIMELIYALFGNEYQSASATYAIGQILNSIRLRRVQIDAEQEQINLSYNGFNNIGVSDQLIQAFFNRFRIDRNLYNRYGAFAISADGKNISVG